MEGVTTGSMDVLADLILGADRVLVF